MIDTQTLPVDHRRDGVISSHSYLKAGVTVEARSPLLNDKESEDPDRVYAAAELVKREVWGRLYGDLYSDLKEIKALAMSVVPDNSLSWFKLREHSALMQRIDALLEKLHPSR